MIAIHLTKHDLLPSLTSNLDSNFIPSINDFKIPSSVLLMADEVHWENKSGRSTTRALIKSYNKHLCKEDSIDLDSSLCVLSNNSCLSERDAKIVHNMIAKRWISSLPTETEKDFFIPNEE